MAAERPVPTAASGNGPDTAARSAPPVDRGAFVARGLAALAGLALFGAARRARASTASDPGAYIGEVRIFSGTFAPSGWLPCNGQIVSLPTYTDLYSVLGTLYGGDGVTTFGVPDLRGRAVVGPGAGPGLTPRALAEAGGVEGYALATNEMGAHSHGFRASAANGISDAPAARVLARDPAAMPIFGATADADLGSGAVGSAGGGLAHNNMAQFLTINFIIAYQGLVPTP